MNFPCLISLLWWRLTSPHPWGHNGRCSGGRQERMSLEAFKIFILGVVAFYLSKILVSHFGSGRGLPVWEGGWGGGKVLPLAQRYFYPLPQWTSLNLPGNLSLEVLQNPVSSFYGRGRKQCLEGGFGMLLTVHFHLGNGYTVCSPCNDSWAVHLMICAPFLYMCSTPSEKKSLKFSFGPLTKLQP